MGVLAAGVAGCSPDSSRFANPSASPYVARKAAAADVTGSVRLSSST